MYIHMNILLPNTARCHRLSAAKAPLLKLAVRVEGKSCNEFVLASFESFGSGLISFWDRCRIMFGSF